MASDILDPSRGLAATHHETPHRQNGMLNMFTCKTISETLHTADVLVN